MCGIFGFYLNRPLTDRDIEFGKGSIAMLGHRGPDDSRVWFRKEDGIFLGHTRLCVIDLSRGSSQPMEKGTSVIAYNGELYNFREIKEDLISEGLEFDSLGDAEVFLKALCYWGTDAFSRFDGMFAFAYYDGQKMMLGIDPFGEKPLYWHKAGEGVYFSSEPFPLVNGLGLEPELDSKRIASFISLGYILPPDTIYKNLYRVEPATCLTIKKSGAPEISRYWQVPKPFIARGKVRKLAEKQVDTLQQTLVASVKSRLISDAPLGLFLSSGVDSALVASIVKKDLHSDIEAFTVGFPGESVKDETRAAQDIAGYLKLRHRVITSSQDKRTPSPAAVFSLYGELNDNLTILPVRQMSELARPHLKVAVSGMGADEAFYGYNKYQFLYRLRRVFALPYPARRCLGYFSGVFFPGHGPMEHLKTLMRAQNEHIFVSIKNHPTYNELFNFPGVRELSRRIYHLFQDMPYWAAARYFDLSFSMPNSYIPAMERGSMHESVEVRTPYLNRRLIELIASMDQRSFVAFGQKCVLRRILSRYLPVNLFRHPKSGFVYPAGKVINSLGLGIPDVPGVPESSVLGIWKKRHKPGYQALSLRLMLIEDIARKV